MERLILSKTLRRQCPQVAMLACCILAGCKAAPPITLNDLVGSYTYKSEDPESKLSDHDSDRLILQANGRYDLVEGGRTKRKSEKTGTWQFYGGEQAQVILDHSGYPAVVEGGEVRLMIDYDTGIWYSKSK